MEKKHLLITSGGFKIGGAERVLLEYLRNINREYFEISLFLMSDFGELAVLKNEIPKDINVKYLKSSEMLKQKEILYSRKNKNLFSKLKYNFFLKNEKKNTKKIFLKYLSEMPKVDIFLDFERSFSIYKDFLQNALKIIWIHSSVKRLNKTIKNFENIVDGYDKIVVICEEMKEEMLCCYPHLREKVYVNYNPVNFEKIKLESGRNGDLTFEEQKLLDQKYIVAVSRIVQGKDFTTLIKAYKLLKESGRKEKLYILGDGEERNNVEKLIKDMELEQDILLLGNKKNPYIWIKNSELLVHSSNFEGLPTILLEGLILEKPVLSSNCSTGPKEILDNGNCGVLFPVGDEVQCFKSMADILSDEVLRDKLVKESRINLKKFNTESIMKNFYDILEVKN